ncbi:Ig-like domain-containing protein [Sphaerisporangium sp. TRM90804]|uniref:L,D-transpeptidase n=1 Tax=Sphaerisporangium sp. TRM90804 TaxID=3031113 RepID=UPI002447685B|nr:Ig-like domain-containing protein [Sphaerisporangium sp. TRM90804]MDH2425942.1 Ig-like domain-containing protein [Sphaerisporangium sp. TRM90804]
MRRSIRDRLRTPIAGLALVMAGLLTASCSSGAPPSTPGADGGTPSAPAVPVPEITISPAKGASKVRPDKRVVVTASNGELQQVTVEAGGSSVEGEFDEARTKWTSKEALKPSSDYTVSATAGGDGGPVTATSTFKTLKPARELRIADITPNVKGETVGIGMPIMVTFNQPVTDKKSVEAALVVTPEKPVDGAWRWINDTRVIYRPAKYWPAHQDVKFTAGLVGVRGGKEMYGVKNYSSTLKVGAAWISTVNTRTHMMVVKKDGKTVKKMPISAGKATTREYTTTSGVHLTMERGNPVTMISPGKKEGDPGYYKEIVNHAVRISNSGEYVHGAPWSVGSQGRANVSHGCINARPDQARWYYDNFHRGDIVKIVGTNRALEWDNGWGFWQMPFKKWRKGSALDA